MLFLIICLITAVILLGHIIPLALLLYKPKRRNPEDGMAIGCLSMVLLAEIALAITFTIAAIFHLTFLVYPIFTIASLITLALVPPFIANRIRARKARLIAKGTQIPAAQLRATLLNHTHTFIYSEGKSSEVLTRLRYYHPDGRLLEFAQKDNATTLLSDTMRWSTSGELLSIENDLQPGNTNSYTLWQTPSGRLAYHLHAPASRANGILSRQTSSIQQGPPA